MLKSDLSVVSPNSWASALTRVLGSYLITHVALLELLKCTLFVKCSPWNIINWESIKIFPSLEYVCLARIKWTHMFYDSYLLGILKVLKYPGKKLELIFSLLDVHFNTILLHYFYSNQLHKTSNEGTWGYQTFLDSTLSFQSEVIFLKCKFILS